MFQICRKHLLSKLSFCFHMGLFTSTNTETNNHNKTKTVIVKVTEKWVDSPLAADVITVSFTFIGLDVNRCEHCPNKRKNKGQIPKILQ